MAAARRLQVFSHERVFDARGFAMKILEESFRAALARPESQGLTDLFGFPDSLCGCLGADAGLQAALGYPSDDATARCTEAMATIVTPIVSLLQPSSPIGATFSVQGSAGLVDADGDLVVEELREGTFSGRLRSEDDVTVTWRAARR